MYNLRYYNPRLGGNVYSGARKCGKANCRCALARKYWHPFYVLEFHERVDGQWTRKREYVPKPKVKALRQQIKRAKKKDLEIQNNTRQFLSQMPGLIKHNPFAAFDSAGKFMKSLKNSKGHHLTKLQFWRIFRIVVDLIDALVSGPVSSA